MLDGHCLQLAAYQLGASELLGEPVREAGVIRTKDYLKTDRARNPKPGPVFYEAPWSYADVPLLLSAVARRVAEVRSGQVSPTPGEDCKWCIGIANCSRIARDVRAAASQMTTA